MTETMKVTKYWTVDTIDYSYFTSTKVLDLQDKLWFHLNLYHFIKLNTNHRQGAWTIFWEITSENMNDWMLFHWPLTSQQAYRGYMRCSVEVCIGYCCSLEVFYAVAQRWFLRVSHLPSFFPSHCFCEAKWNGKKRAHQITITAFCVWKPHTHTLSITFQCCHWSWRWDF